MLYAFARTARDTALREGAGSEASDELRARASAIYRRGERDLRPSDRALASVVRAFEIPRAAIEAFVEGLIWDLDGRRYASFDGLLDRSIHLGSSLAVIGAAFMHDGRRETLSHQLLSRATDLGIALALTSVARDVGVDASRGRLLLPVEWLEEEGVDVDAWVAHRAPLTGVRRVTARVLEAAEGYYQRAEPGIASVPFDCRAAVRALSRIHAAHAARIEAAGFDSVTSRSRVSTRDKARILFRSLGAGSGESIAASRPPSPAAAFLVDAFVRPSTEP